MSGRIIVKSKNSHVTTTIQLNATRSGPTRFPQVVNLRATGNFVHRRLHYYRNLCRYFAETHSRLRRNARAVCCLQTQKRVGHFICDHRNAVTCTLLMINCTLCTVYTDFVCYNSDMRQPILITFGRTVDERVSYQILIYFSSFPD